MGKFEISQNEDSGNEINLSNLSAFKKSSYLTSKGVKKGGGNSNNSGGSTKKGVQAIRGYNYLTLGTKKAFHLLQHAFT